MTVPSRPLALRVGERLDTPSFGPLTATDIVRYAGASGDFNPIHHDEGFARAAGHPGVFGMGLLHGGVLGIRLARWVGPDNVRTFTVRFTGQVWPGDVLDLELEVTAVQDGLATIALAARRRDGDEVLRGTATARVA